MAVEGILIHGVTEILNKLVPVVAQEICFAWGVKDELKKLQGTLEMILAVIADAEKRQVTEEAVRVWLRRLKDVAYDCDDVIDELSWETMRRRERDSFKYKAHDFVSSSNPLAFRFKLSRKIKEINSKLDEITKDMDRFQLKTIPSRITCFHGERRSRQTTSFACQSQIVGREDDKNKLIKTLTTVVAASLSNTGNHLENVHVVSIVGMGGLGKTTLAQLIYNDDSVKQHFEPKIWVCVSDDFDVYRLLSDIMESITQKKFSSLSNFDVLVRKVREQLTGKRYLLVLDDLWNEDAEQWERLLQGSLIVGAQGSKILVTTRKRQVADVVKGSISPYLLQRLQADECWSIMERKAFSPGGALKTPNMINIGKEIANKCSGLPLAAKFLGSLMHSKNKESNWLSIRENDMWNTPETKITPILKLSYDNLSPPLQRCFSYCSIFPKDCELSKQTLIQLWMAEGCLQVSNMGNDCSFEDIGEEFFESLLWSSFFDGVKRNELDDIITFKMHDLVHDLAQAVVGYHECSTVKVTNQLEQNSQVRRINFIMDQQLSPSFPKTLSTMNKLRTIIILEPNYKLNLAGFSSKHLRILHLGCPAKDFSTIRYTTSKLRQLRYFHISSLNLRGNLLDDHSLSRLYNLQTLVLSGCHLVKNLVKGMRSLKHLRHLDISFTDIQELPDSVTSLPSLQRLDMNNCKKITKFPNSVTGLQYLKFLDMSFTRIEEIPGFIINLHQLQTLNVNSCEKLKSLPEYVTGLNNLRIFDFKNCPLLVALPKDFGALTQLRYLNLYGTEIKVVPESCANLHNLEFLHLFKCEVPKDVAIWRKLRKFDCLNIGTTMGIGELLLLQTLSYTVPKRSINNDGIEELWNLNFLEELHIYRLENVEGPTDAERANLKRKQNLRALELNWDNTEEELGMSREQKSCNAFQVFEALQPPTGLRYLKICNFLGWDLPAWMCGQSCLSELEHLVLENCREITQLPAVIWQLPRLCTLELAGIPLKSLDVGGFPSLLWLNLTDMFLLEELCYSSPPCLQDLVIKGCKSLTEIPSFPSLTRLVLEKIGDMLVRSIWRSQMTSLTSIWLENIEELVYFPISILQHYNLQILSIKKCNKFEGFGVIDEDENGNVVALHSLPQQDQRMHTCFVLISSLQELNFFDCPVFKFLPPLLGWIYSLKGLTIFNCPQLEESLTYDLKSLSFLGYLYVDFIQRNEQRGNPSAYTDLINLMEK